MVEFAVVCDAAIGDEFDFGLDLVLDGIARMLNEPLPTGCCTGTESLASGA